MKNLVLRTVLAWSLGCAAALVHAQSVNTVLVASGLSQPLYATSPVAGGPVYIVEKGGTIKAVQGGTASTFLQIPVGTAGERGLLGLAFDPNYAVVNAAGYGRFFVDYIDPSTNQTVIASYRTNGNPLAADPATRVEVMRINQTPTGQSNHKGGWIGFKPGDTNHLYIATGDGGSANDPSNQAQNRGLLLGKMLRIDINGDDFPADPNTNYAVPPTNPYYGQAGIRGEIYAWGLRNPFRNSFDRLTGDLWIADVGQNSREEVDLIPAASIGGQNFGWRIREGEIATPGISDPPVSGLTGPALTYNHSFGVAITGGYVVRQAGSPLYGMYVFGDYGSGRIWAIDTGLLANGQLHTLAETTELTAAIDAGAGGVIGNVSSFGEGAGGELYVVDFGGKVVQVTFAPGTVALTVLSLAANSVNSGSTTTGTVTLSAPATADTVVSLASSNPTASVPASVTVPQGATSASFVLSGFGVTRSQRSLNSTITATLGSNSRSATVSVVQRP